MRHYWLTSDAPDLPLSAFRKGLGKNRPDTLEGGKGGDSPAPPDPYATADAQTKSNQQTAAFNRAMNLGNFTNPFGSQQTTQVGTDPSTGAPLYQTSITANPQLQQAMNGLLGQVGNSGNINQNALNGLTGLNNSLSMDAAQNAQSNGQRAAYSTATQYLDPQFSQNEESLRASLANQGLTPGSEAYNNAMLNFGNQKQQAYSNALNQSVLTGSQIGSQNMQNQISALNAKAGLYGQQVGIGQTPYSNLQSIASMIPGYSGSPTTNTNPADIANYMNNQYQGQLASHNADVASSNQTMSTIGQVGSMAAMAFMMY